jgi:predicted RNase H-related nuclease YkuK (DUF458 family)
MEKESKTVFSFKQPYVGKRSTLEEVVDIYVNQIKNDKFAHLDDWQIIISTDSQRMKKSYTYATVLCLYKIGNSARYFYSKKIDKDRPQIVERLIREVMLSIELAEQLKETNLYSVLSMDNIIIDMDVSPKVENKSNLAVSSVTAIAKGFGYNFRIKPESMASYVADRHCKNHAI